MASKQQGQDSSTASKPVIFFSLHHSTRLQMPFVWENSAPGFLPEGLCVTAAELCHEEMCFLYLPTSWVANIF